MAGGRTGTHPFERRRVFCPTQFAAVCACKQIQCVDPGASGGVWGLAKRCSMMNAGATHASNLTHPQPVDAALQRFQRSVLGEA